MSTQRRDTDLRGESRRETGEGDGERNTSFSRAEILCCWILSFEVLFSFVIVS